jgi:phage shock protein PspC (stress-responsive transcriptional regulator)
MQTNLFTRPDTLFGICEGLGEDLGIHPNLLRVSLAGLLFWNPAAALVAYVGAGAIVALSRWLFPNPRIVATAAAASLDELRAAQEPEPLQATGSAEAEPVPLAA